VAAGVVCFLVLGGALVGGLGGYQHFAHSRDREHASRRLRAITPAVQRLDAALEQARGHLRNAGPSLATEDRIKVNQAIVIVEENLAIYAGVLSNASASLGAGRFEFFRSDFDPGAQSNLLEKIERDRRSLDHVNAFCRERERPGQPRKDSR
jgi:hypothetical protein